MVENTLSVLDFPVGVIVYILIVAFAFGTVFGSFLTCLADRLVHHESIVRGRSHCDHCGHVLGAADLVPIFSWLFLKGKCRYCGTRIPPRDVIAECMMGAVFAGSILRFGLGMEAVRWIACACSLLALSLVDLDSYLIPDRFLAAMLVIYAVTLPFTGYGDSTVLFNQWASPFAAQLVSGLCGAAALGIGMLVMSLVFDKVTGKESLGGGDIKLFFVAGLYLGPLKGLLCLIVSCVIGLIFAAAAKKKRIPFGPSISAAMLLVGFFGEPVVQWYVGLLG